MQGQGAVLTTERYAIVWAYLHVVGALLLLGFAGIAVTDPLRAESSLYVGLGGIGLLILSANVLKARNRPSWIRSSFLWLMIGPGTQPMVSLRRLADGVPLLIRSNRAVIARLLIVLGAAFAPFAVLDAARRNFARGAFTLAGAFMLCTVGLMVRSPTQHSLLLGRWVCLALVPYAVAVAVFMQIVLRHFLVVGQLIGALFGGATVILLLSVCGSLAELARREARIS